MITLTLRLETYVPGREEKEIIQVRIVNKGEIPSSVSRRRKETLKNGVRFFLLRGNFGHEKETGFGCRKEKGLKVLQERKRRGYPKGDAS